MRNTLSKSAFIIREPKRIYDGLKDIESIKKHVDLSAVTTTDEVEAANMVAVAEQILMAASARKNTTGESYCL